MWTPRTSWRATTTIWWILKQSSHAKWPHSGCMSFIPLTGAILSKLLVNSLIRMHSAIHYSHNMIIDHNIKKGKLNKTIIDGPARFSCCLSECPPLYRNSIRNGSRFVFAIRTLSNVHMKFSSAVSQFRNLVGSEIMHAKCNCIHASLLLQSNA